MKWIWLLLLCCSASAQSPLASGSGIEWTRAPGNTWTTSNPPNLVIWINPTNSPDTNVDGGDITYLTNAVNGSLFTPLIFKYSSGNKMTYRASAGRNGRPAIHTSGSNMDASIAGASQPTTNWANYTIFAVLRATNSGYSQLGHRGFPWNFGVGSPFIMETNGFWTVTDSAVKTNIQPSEVGGYFNYTNGWFILTQVCSNNVHYLYTNGTLCCITNNIGTTPIGNSFFFGVANGAQSAYFGYYGDFLVYGTNLTDANRVIVENNFKSVWSIPYTPIYPIQTLVTNQTIISSRNDGTAPGHVGFFGVPQTDMFITAIGRYSLAPTGTVHVGYVYVNTNAANVLQASTFINLAGQNTNQYIFSNLTTLAFIAGGASSMFIETQETNTDRWGDAASSHCTITINNGALEYTVTSSAVNEATGGTPANTSYVPPNILYWRPWGESN